MEFIQAASLSLKVNVKIDQFMSKIYNKYLTLFHDAWLID